MVIMERSLQCQTLRIDVIVVRSDRDPSPIRLEGYTTHIDQREWCSLLRELVSLQ